MNHQQHLDRRISRAVFPNSLLCCLGVIAALATVALARYPKFFLQRDALTYVYEIAGILTAYAVLICLLARTKGVLWDVIRRRAVVFGITTGAAEVLNIAIENVAPTLAHTPGFSGAFMFGVFITWGVAAAWTERQYRVRWASVLAAISSAGICMLIAVLAGFLMEFFVARPNLSDVVGWAEYKRSGWPDVQAFSIANTLDSGFTHLLLALVVAAIFGTVGTFLTRTQRDSIQS